MTYCYTQFGLPDIQYVALEMIPLIGKDRSIVKNIISNVIGEIMHDESVYIPYVSLSKIIMRVVYRIRKDENRNRYSSSTVMELLLNEMMEIENTVMSRSDIDLCAEKEGLPLYRCLRYTYNARQLNTLLMNALRMAHRCIHNIDGVWIVSGCIRKRLISGIKRLSKDENEPIEYVTEHVEKGEIFVVHKQRMIHIDEPCF